MPKRLNKIQNFHFAKYREGAFAISREFRKIFFVIIFHFPEHCGQLAIKTEVVKKTSNRAFLYLETRVTRVATRKYDEHCEHDDHREHLAHGGYREHREHHEHREYAEHDEHPEHQEYDGCCEHREHDEHREHPEHDEYHESDEHDEHHEHCDHDEHVKH